MKLKIVKSHLADKKYDAIFTYEDGKTKKIENIIPIISN